jgi:hypothetical protein
MQIGGVRLPTGVLVVPSIYLMHRRPDIYPDAERFRPERFLEQRAGTYTWIPFGGGDCLDHLREPGTFAAAFEKPTTLDSRHHDLRAVGGHQNEPQPPGCGIALSPTKSCDGGVSPSVLGLLTGMAERWQICHVNEKVVRALGDPGSFRAPFPRENA